MVKTKKPIVSLIAMLLCVSMLVGMTFAWFTDSFAANKNIESGKLDVEMYWTKDMSSRVWHNAGNEKDGVPIDEKNWEPGYTIVRYVKIVNAGDLALNYSLKLDSLGTIGKLAEVIGVYYSAGVVSNIADRTLAGMSTLGSLKTAVNGGEAAKGNLAPRAETVVAVALKMDETAGNEYQKADIGDGFIFKLVATQATAENDGFDNTYDEGALPEFEGGELAIDVSGKVKDNVLTEDVVIASKDGSISAHLLKGTKLKDGVSALTLKVTEKSSSDANVTPEDGQQLRPLDVHVEGVAADNTVPVIIGIKNALAKGLNIGNYTLYHVENGETVAMTYVAAAESLSAHNQFSYDPATGDVTLAMATFSEVAMVAEDDKAWKGNYDYSWYTNAVAPVDGESEADYIIANADQLAGFGAIVGGMDGQTQDSFNDKTVKLVADINIGDISSENGIVFYPIGYYNSTGSYEKVSEGSVSSSVSSFRGTFDGNGHTISNFYQNTWEMFGDYNDGYSGTPNYYKDAMGLFGYVYGGTVKNLTVDNFSSDGEFTPTGVIAAYAAGDAKFENIAITNCNPRVYNTGNGGIIGIAGDTSAANDDHIALKNITVDNSNKISALWGSWDVACGGLVGMYRGNVDGSGNATGDTISFENCHVSAQIDVYNDVCANYQYYAYRYSGMIIGSVRHNTTNAEGKTIPNMAGISATGCTVNYGDWNDYYYCEFEKNTMASYSEDYQFSRVPHSELNFTDTNGNGVVDADERASVTGCKHTHTANEDKQAVYLPFHQLFTGYSWGVSSIGLEKYSGIVTNLGITEGEQQESVEKFKGIASESYKSGVTVNIGELFEAKVPCDLDINSFSVVVAVTPVGEDSTAGGVFVADIGDWTKGTLTFTGAGKAKITITDYYFCKTTTIYTEILAIEKFKSNFTNTNFVYRVGNEGAVNLGTLFAKIVDDVSSNTVSVEITNVSGNASGAFVKNSSDWTKGTIDFNGTGVVEVSITDNKACTPTTLKLEVVDAVNATGATSATSNNVVLLNDCGFSSLEVSGGYTLYGNGFTMTCSSDSPALDTGYAFVTLNNGTLDNVQIVCPNFDYAVLYKSNMTESGNRSETTDRTRYYNAKSGVMVSGNSQILNSRISGGRAAVNVTGGNCLIDNSRIELGAVASLLVGSANGLTLRDVTLVQKPTASTYDPSKVLMGFSTLFVCDADGNTAPVTIEGTLVQNAWVNETDKQYVPSAGQSIISTVLGKTDYLHDIDGDGKNESLNLGFAYMPESLTSKVNTTTITDNRTNKDTVPYDYAEVSILNGKTYVYSYKNTNGTADAFKTESEYKPNKYSNIITVTYSDVKDGLESGKSFGTDGWVYELNVDLDKLSGYAIDFSKLSMSVNGVDVTDFKVNGSAKPTSPVAVVAGGTTYTLTATVDDKDCTVYFKVIGTETTKEPPSLVASNYAAALLVGEAGSTLSKDTWHGAAPVLDGIQIKYWSVAEKQYKTIALSDYTPTTGGKQNGTNTTWTYTPDNGDFTLTITGGQVHSSNKVSAMPVVCNGKLYFVAASSNGLVNYGNSARTIPVTYSFKDNNGGKELKFSYTWSIECADKATAYDYSDFCNGTSKTFTIKASNGNTCVTGDTLVMLADGTQKRIDKVTYSDQLLVWNFFIGDYDVVPAAIIFYHGDDYYRVLQLNFSDGTKVKVLVNHGFFNVNKNEFVFIDEENVDSYIGQSFIKVDGQNRKSVKLIGYDIYNEYTGSYSIQSAVHINFMVEGMFSLTLPPFEGWFDYFEIGEGMKYDPAKMQADIEKYGLYEYSDFAEYVTYEQFIAFNGPYLKVLVGRGVVTYEEILRLIATYVN